VAIDCTLSNREALLRYTEDGELEIDSNGAERSLRPIVVGRNNWLFNGSDKGGRTGAVLSSLIASCKRLRVEPFAYLRDLFTRISTHPHHRIDELLPDKWLVGNRIVQLRVLRSRTLLVSATLKEKDIANHLISTDKTQHALLAQPVWSLPFLRATTNGVVGRFLLA